MPKLRIHNANALSSAYTIGFPAMTAWLGLAHALQRGLAEKFPCKFAGVGVVSHDFNLQTYKGVRDFDSSIIGMASPLKRDGKRASFIEEPRCHLTVSLMIEYEALSFEEAPEYEIVELISKLLNSRLKFAGGDLMSHGKPERMIISDENKFKILKRKLMPGFLLRERRDLMIKSMEKEEGDALDSLLSYLSVHSSCDVVDEKVSWQRIRREKGWIVPIAVGFQGITPLGAAENQRDADTPHRFAESIITLGEFVVPYRLESVDEMLWRYHVNADKSQYVCSQQVI
ncbi:type I-F CRISPR-associated protein Csy2 [Piscirickettsia litoralis]|uniref:type I-F CRISPR-associated protein Csy2 n=1 Tax=Piscirickettsia litoralis TaxID=1891921 RepID=UPI000AF61806|nr:type I-F CRISPR-associated protein Csy2 [Piscirickettsia litoralis]